MTRFKNILFNTSLALNCLLLFLLIFENRLAVPVWLQVAGRMHPLILHFPIVLIILYALLSLVNIFQRRTDSAFQDINSVILILAAFTSVITALAGLFLSRETGYDPETLRWHKWSGVAVSVFTLGWYSFNLSVVRQKAPAMMMAALAIFLISFAGHQGAGITHGQNFLLAPMMPEEKHIAVSPEDAIVFTHMVKPILEKKCESCHNEKKAKGELIMETEALLLKGGKSGALWDTAANDLGLMMKRVHLPLEEKKHMPPQGKPQLTEEEIGIITRWIRKGADFNLRVIDLPQDDTLRQIAYRILNAAEIAEYDFEEAEPSVIEKLNTENRVVNREALGSPALTVNFFNSRLFSAEQLKELDKIRKQIVSLDLARMPVKDEDISLIAKFENLRRLNLGFSEITGKSLGELKSLKHLKSLTLSGTKVSAASLKNLQQLPQLHTVHTWNTAIPKEELEQLQSQIKNIRFEPGYRGDTTVMKLSLPVLLNEEVFLTEETPLRLKHYIQGASIRYTTDGSEPDSVKSLLFKGTETINTNTLIRARAFKPGWISSDMMEARFYRSTYTPDTVIYLTKANERYRDETGELLLDRQKGEADFRFGNWLGYRENRGEILLEFKNPIRVQNVTLSTLVDPGSYIMPAQSIEIWGGEDPQQLKLLDRIVPEQPTKILPSAMKGYEANFQPVTLRYIRIVGNPVTKLPGWHPGKGDKAWWFIDEVLVN
jgi:uncharacterized membrane protein